MIIEYKINPKEVHEAIKEWICKNQKVSREQISDVRLMSNYDNEHFVVTVDTDQRYAAGKD